MALVCDEGAIATAFRRDGYQVTMLPATIDGARQLEHLLALHPQCVDLLVIDCTAGLPGHVLEPLLRSVDVHMLLLTDEIERCEYAARWTLVPRVLDVMRTAAFEVLPPVQPAPVPTASLRQLALDRTRQVWSCFA